MSSSFAVSRALYANVHALNIANQLARQAAQMLPISTFVHMTEEDDFGRPLPNPSPLFNSPTADLVLSSSNSYHVRTGWCGKFKSRFLDHVHSLEFIELFYRRLHLFFMPHLLLYLLIIRQTLLQCKVGLVRCPAQRHTDDY
jgi:hypothetical protein